MTGTIVNEVFLFLLNCCLLPILYYFCVCKIVSLVQVTNVVISGKSEISGVIGDVM